MSISVLTGKVNISIEPFVMTGTYTTGSQSRLEVTGPDEYIQLVYFKRISGGARFDVTSNGIVIFSYATTGYDYNINGGSNKFIIPPNSHFKFQDVGIINVNIEAYGIKFKNS